MEAAISPFVGIPDFSFGLGDPNFSDRILLLQFLDDTHPNPNTEARVKTIHISSLVLAARSPVFFKMFSNGMRESEEKNVTVQIKTSEEITFMNLLKYVYSNNLPTAVDALLDLSVMADKYEIASCLRDCSISLQNLPMTCESASLHLDLPSSLLTSPTFQPLIDAAKQFLVSNFKDFADFERFQEEMLKLPLAGIQAVLSSDDLQVTSEFQVFKLVLAWVHNHYPNLKERRMILKTHLLHLVRFPFMTTTELTEKVQTCSDIDPEVALKIVISALCFKAESPYQKRCLAAKEANAASRQYVERAYKLRSVKVVELELPNQHCIVYLNFTREKLTHMFPEGVIRSERFHLGEEEAVLFASCDPHVANNIPHFWLVLEMLGSSTCIVNYEIQLRMKPQEEFRCWAKGSQTFTDSENAVDIGYVPWTEFIGDDSPYFINDILHVRAEFTFKKYLNNWM